MWKRFILQQVVCFSFVLNWSLSQIHSSLIYYDFADYSTLAETTGWSETMLIAYVMSLICLWASCLKPQLLLDERRWNLFTNFLPAPVKSSGALLGDGLRLLMPVLRLTELEIRLRYAPDVFFLRMLSVHDKNIFPLPYGNTSYLLCCQCNIIFKTYFIINLTWFWIWSYWILLLNFSHSLSLSSFLSPEDLVYSFSISMNPWLILK